MVRRARTDPVAWLLVLVAIGVTAVAGLMLRDLIASAGCPRDTDLLDLIDCATSPELWQLLVAGLLAIAAWCGVWMRAARLPR